MYEGLTQNGIHLHLHNSLVYILNLVHLLILVALAIYGSYQNLALALADGLLYSCLLSNGLNLVLTLL